MNRAVENFVIMFSLMIAVFMLIVITAPQREVGPRLEINYPSVTADPNVHIEFEKPLITVVPNGK